MGEQRFFGKALPLFQKRNSIMKAIGLVFEEEDEAFIMERLRAIQQKRPLDIYPDSPLS